MVEKKAYAKVNLSLDITGRREDGYHLVKMVMQSLDIADILTFEKTVASGDSRIETLLKDNRYEEQSSESGMGNTSEINSKKSDSELGK